MQFKLRLFFSVFLVSLIMLTGIAVGDQPLVEVEAIPSDDVMELYTESEGLFALRVLELYRDAVILQTQLQLMGIDTVWVQIPTMDDLTSVDEDVLRRYYKQAKKYEDLIRQSNRQVVYHLNEQLREDLRDSRNHNYILQDSLYRLNLDVVDKEYLRALLDTAMIRIGELKGQLIQCITHGEITDRKLIIKTVPVLTGSLSGHNMFTHESPLDSDISFGAGINLALSRLMGYGHHFELALRYIRPRLFIKRDLNWDDSYQEEFLVHWFTTGINIILWQIPIYPENYIQIKAGGGFFWGETRLPNNPSPKSTLTGQTVNFEIATFRHDIYFPIDIFIGYSLSFPTKNVIFHSPNGNYDYERTLLDELHLGVRFKIWNL